MTKDDIPTWVRQKAVDLANAERDAYVPFVLGDGSAYGPLRAFAKYIAAHEEEEPVDPLLLEAREMCAQRSDDAGGHRTAKAYRSGKHDSGYTVRKTLEVLRRGVEIGRAEAAATDAEGAKQ